MEIKFSGKRAIVTGAGLGIGRGIAKALAEGGAETFVLSRTKDDLDTLKAEVPAIHIYQVDVGNWEKTREIVESIGTVDLLVNNAGILRLTPLVDIQSEEVDSIMKINLKSVINISQIVAKGLIKEGRKGAIVNISSNGSLIAFPAMTTYSASKAAIDAISRSMALELGPHHIRVNSVNPTFVNTKMAKMVLNDEKEMQKLAEKVPLQRFAEVKDVVHAVLYLLSDQVEMIHGVCLPVDGGELVC